MAQQFGFGNGLPSLDEFFQAQRNGWVVSQTRKTAEGHTYRIFNYSKRAQFHRIWTPVTLVARGLIYCEETLDIVALALDKFFNLGERISDTECATIRSGPFEALVKLDGALGIGYRINTAISIATRGSFNSPQALAAQAIWNEKYKQHEHLFYTEWNHITPLVEIIHPVSQVVVQYDYQDLVLIAARNRFTGEDLPYEFLVEMAQRLGMPVVERFGSDDIDSILHRVRELDSNHEGVVLHWPGYRVKAKGDAYTRVHRLLSGATPQRVAAAWLNGTDEELLMTIPEEFRDKSEKILVQLEEQLVASVLETEAIYATAPQVDQRAFASWVNQNHSKMSASLFVRRQLDKDEFSNQLVTQSIASAVKTGHIHSLLTESRHKSLIANLRNYEQAVGDVFWNFARDAESGPRLQLEVRKLAHKSLRSAMCTGVEELKPELVEIRVQQYLNQPEQKALYCDLDAQSIFAKAPSPDSPLETHYQWIAQYSPQLRSFLDRWRCCGRRQSATNEARNMLAVAIRNNCVSNAAPSQIDCTELAMQIAQLTNEVKEVWNSIPRQQGPQAMLQFARNNKNAWVTILLSEVWHSHRDAVCKQFLANLKDDATTFDDEG